MKQHSVRIAIITLITGLSGTLYGVEPDPNQLPDLGGPQATEVRGSELMTAEERRAFRARMQAADSPEARQAIRAEQHEKMQQRAKEKGLKLSDEPAADRGAGQRRRMGIGRGMGMNR